MKPRYGAYDIILTADQVEFLASILTHMSVNCEGKNRDRAIEVRNDIYNQMINQPRPIKERRK